MKSKITPEKIPVNAGEIQGRFQPGHSGNPNGRPKGSRNKATIAIEALLNGEAEKLSRKAVELALDGDTTALSLCLKMIISPRKDNPVVFDLPTSEKGIKTKAGIENILQSVAAGKMSPVEGTAVLILLEKAMVLKKNNDDEEDSAAKQQADLINSMVVKSKREIKT